MKISSAQKEHLLQLLRQVRLEAGLHQADLAKQLGRPQSFVSKYERGERRLDLLELLAICEVLGISLIDFVRRLEESMNESC
jgi:transcriptional regulator with XRE-family HTH domain